MELSIKGVLNQQNNPKFTELASYLKLTPKLSPSTSLMNLFVYLQLIHTLRLTSMIYNIARICYTLL